MAKANNALDADDLKIIKHAVAAHNFNAEPVDENVLGRGKFGAVVRATLKETGRVYAIKVMPYTSEAERVKYQKRELELLVKLKCSDSNVIRYLDHWAEAIEGTQTYIICIQMELCLTSLANWMFTNPFCQANPRFYKHVFPHILNGLDAIHNIGWVHRDIHPGNLLITNPAPKKIQDMVIKIADFGLARKISTEPSVPTLSSPKELDEISPNVGNEFYRAPEMSTRKYDNKVDLYSAGIVLYVMTCTGPVEENWYKELTELRNKKRGKDHLFHQDKMLIEMLFERLLQESPEKRPSAAEALERFSTAEVDGANPASSKAGIDFLVKRENEDNWNHCTSREDSLSGFEEAVRDLYNIKHGNLSLCQELLDNGEKLRVNVNSSADVKKMLRSAEEKNHKVRLIIPVGASSGNKISEGNFAYDAMELT